MKLITAFIFSLLFIYTASAQIPAQLVGKWFEGSTSILSENPHTERAGREQQHAAMSA